MSTITEHFNSQILDRIALAGSRNVPANSPTPGNWQEWLYNNDPVHGFKRNPNCWCRQLVNGKPIDTSAIAAGFTNYGSTFGGSEMCTLISPTQAIYCAHIHLGQNLDNGHPRTYTFVGTDEAETVVVATVAAYDEFPGYMEGSGIDLSVITFAEPLPACIKPAKLMPANWWNYFHVGEPQNVLGLKIHRDNSKDTNIAGRKHYEVGTFQYKTKVGYPTCTLYYNDPPTDAAVADYYYSIMSGDSGTAHHFVHDGQLVVCAVTSNSMMGVNPNYFFDWLRSKGVDC